MAEYGDRERRTDADTAGLDEQGAGGLLPAVVAHRCDGGPHLGAARGRACAERSPANRNLAGPSVRRAHL